MKKATLFIFAICSVAMSYSDVKWFGENRSSSITDPTNWYLDEERTIQADSAPTAGGNQDTAIMYSEKTDWRGVYLYEKDTYLYNVVITGNHHMNYGDLVLDKITDDKKVYLDIAGTLSSPIIERQSNPEIGGSLGGKTGEIVVEMTAGKIDIGTEIYGGKTFSSYGNMEIKIGSTDNRITAWNLTVNGDIRMGGALEQYAGCVLNLVTDKVSVGGILSFARNGSSYSNMFFSKSAIFEVGGIKSDGTDAASNYTIHNSQGSSFNSTIVLKNAARTDYKFTGIIADDGNNRPNISDVKAVMNVTMEGEGVQRIFNAKDSATDIQARQSGTYTVKNGRLIMDNSRIAADYRQAKLSMEGGKFGAGHYDSSQTGAAYFKTANFKSGGFAYENFVNHNVFDDNPSDKVIITDTFTKTEGSGKISVDFSDASGNALNLAKYDYALAESAESIEMWTEILTASELSGFNLEKRLSDGVYDANADFVAEGIENGIAVFKWVELTDNGYSLQVGFAQVPEPESVAVIFSAVILAIAMRRKMK